jgi:SAM-dependent methyltransferase
MASDAHDQYVPDALLPRKGGFVTAPGSGGDGGHTDGTDQRSMVHRLPSAPLVDRIDYLRSVASGQRVIHLGFVDSGFRTMQERAGAWLHAQLDEVATGLVGLDLDADGVALAAADGYAAHAVDCCDPAAVRSLDLEPAPVVIAGELVEHLDAPGGFFEAVHALVAPGGQLVVTTPNAYGLLNVAASLGRREVNHPDHVVLFTWRTLTAMAARHGWEPSATAVYVPTVKPAPGADLGTRLSLAAGRAVCAVERTAARLGRPFSADGLIVSFRPVR